MSSDSELQRLSCGSESEPLHTKMRAVSSQTKGARGKFKPIYPTVPRDTLDIDLEIGFFT